MDVIFSSPIVFLCYFVLFEFQWKIVGKLLEKIGKKFMSLVVIVIVKVYRKNKHGIHVELPLFLLIFIFQFLWNFLIYYFMEEKFHSLKRSGYRESFSKDMFCCC